LAAHPHAVALTQLRVHAPRAVGAVRTLVAGMDQRSQLHVLAIMLRQRTTPPIVKAARGDLQQPAHHTHRKGVLVRSHESEEFFAFGLVSCANQAAAFARISRSILSRLFSRRRRVSSARSVVLRPPSPRPASRSACLTHNAIVQGVGPNSRASSGMPRPARCSSTICRRNSAVYRFEVFDLAIRDSCHANCKESVKAGPDHSSGPVRLTDMSKLWIEWLRLARKKTARGSASPLGAVLMRSAPNNHPRRQTGCRGSSHSRGSKENDTGAPIFNWPKSACRGFRM